ncbi:UNVERIFIED_CONTAM: FKBP12-associated protein [Siphonaria sp. JEL0065]|nr:FKBP12-associated protein [Siphonaria sp. JEL0065]
MSPVRVLEHRAVESHVESWSRVVYILANVLVILEIVSMQQTSVWKNAIEPVLSVATFVHTLAIETCPCGNKTGDFPCGAWKENSGRGSTTTRLQCDDSCAVLKRNRALAEALEIDTASFIATPLVATTTVTPSTELPIATSSVSATAVLEPLETQLHILKYAYQNLIWCRTVEKVLHDFVNDPIKKTHHYMCTKPLGIRFIVALAPYYALDAEVVDANWGAAKMSVILRKRLRGKAGVPSVLCSAIAPNYQAIAAAAMTPPIQPTEGEDLENSEESREVNDGNEEPATDRNETPVGIPAPYDPSAPISSTKTAVNGYKITNLTGALEDVDLCALIEPVLGCPVAITWLIGQDTSGFSSNDCVVQLVEGGVDMSQVEYVLANHADTLYGKLVMDGFAEDLEMCWLNYKQVVTSTVTIGMKAGRKGKEFKDMPQKKRPVGIGRESKFSALMDGGD